MMIGWILDSRRIFDVPDRLTDVTSWHTHMPFAFWCVEALRPRVLVELGTHRGDSYSAFCQAVARVGLPTACYAVDTWRGDPQAGEYGEEIYREYSEYHDARFGSFSRLVRSTFDEAAAHFADGSIDLLHVDGLHTYDAARKDLETWAPRLSPAAVVLFHDVNVREKDFGVWRFWEELRRERPGFTFHHGHGLGVLLWGRDAPEPARRLVESSEQEAVEIRRLFAQLGEASAVRGRLRACERERQVADERVQKLTEEGSRREQEAAARAERCAQELARVNQQLAERDRALAERDRALAERDGELAKLTRELGELRRRWSRSLARLVEELPRRLLHAGRVALLLVYWTVTFQLPGGLRRRKYARLIRRAQLFDPAFYLSQLAAPTRVRDPLDHYLREGAARGLDPNPFFDTSWYMEHNPDVVAAGKDPLVHYLRYGAGEGRATGPRFDTAFYLARYPDVMGSELNPLAHFLLFGAAKGLEGVSPHAAVDIQLDGPGAAVFLDRSQATRALVIDHRLLTPREDSGSVRMLAILRLLRGLGMPVTFGADQEQRSEADERPLRELGIELLFGRRAIAEHLRNEGQTYAVALLSRAEVANRYMAQVRGHALWARVFYDTVDLHWVRMERAADVTGDPATKSEAGRLRRLEQMLAAAADVTLTVTPGEQHVLQEAVPSARVEVIPNIHSVRSGNRSFGDRRDLMFIGGFEHEPNVDAVEWFVREIFPRIRGELPGVVFRVVGSKLPPRLKALESPDVKMLGWVADVAPVFQSSRVFVAPVRFGAGMLGKIGQSIEHGLPVVTTPIGAEGMGLVNGETVLVADAPEAFVAAVVRLYREELLWSRLARNAARLVDENFSETAVAQRLQSLLASAGSTLGERNAGGRTP